MIYKINTLLTGSIFVVSPDVAIPDGFDTTGYQRAIIGDEAMARSLLAEHQQRYLQVNDLMFVIGKTTVKDNDTVWSAATTDDPEDGQYHVFNWQTGQYDDAPTLSNAMSMLDALKREYLVAHGLGDLELVDELPTEARVMQPSVLGAQTL